MALSITTTRTTGSIGSTCPPLSRVWQSKATNQPTSQPVTTEQEKYKPTRTALRLSINDIETLQHSRRGRESETPSNPPPKPLQPSPNPSTQVEPHPSPTPHPPQTPKAPNTAPNRPRPPPNPQPSDHAQTHLNPPTPPEPAHPNPPPHPTAHPQKSGPFHVSNFGNAKKKESPQKSPKFPKNPQKSSKKRPPKNIEKRNRLTSEFSGYLLWVFGWAAFWGVFLGILGDFWIFGDLWGFLGIFGVLLVWRFASEQAREAGQTVSGMGRDEAFRTVRFPIVGGQAESHRLGPSLAKECSEW